MLATKDRNIYGKFERVFHCGTQFSCCFLSFIHAFFVVLTYRLKGDETTVCRHIILILSQLVIALFPKCCVLSGEATNTNFVFVDLPQLGLEHTSSIGELSNCLR
jgi:hypothetical protein